jgi:hypothetical protein
MRHSPHLRLALHAQHLHLGRGPQQRGVAQRVHQDGQALLRGAPHNGRHHVLAAHHWVLLAGGLVVVDGQAVAVLVRHPPEGKARVMVVSVPAHGDAGVQLAAVWQWRGGVCAAGWRTSTAWCGAATVHAACFSGCMAHHILPGCLLGASFWGEAAGPACSRASRWPAHGARHCTAACTATCTTAPPLGHGVVRVKGLLSCLCHAGDGVAALERARLLL